jgi:hypothetical protein
MNKLDTWVEKERIKLEYLLNVKDQVLCITDDEWDDIEEISMILFEYPDRGPWSDSDEHSKINMVRTIDDRVRWITAMYKYRQTLQPEGEQ